MLTKIYKIENELKQIKTNFYNKCRGNMIYYERKLLKFCKIKKKKYKEN